MTFEELCFRTKLTPGQLERLAAAGVLGDRLKESTEGRWRHITKDMAANALLARFLLDQGLSTSGIARLVPQKREITEVNGQRVLTIGSMTFQVPEKVDLDV